MYPKTYKKFGSSRLVDTFEGMQLETTIVMTAERFKQKPSHLVCVFNISIFHFDMET